MRKRKQFRPITFTLEQYIHIYIYIYIYIISMVDHVSVSHARSHAPALRQVARRKELDELAIRENAIKQDTEVHHTEHVHVS